MPALRTSTFQTPLGPLLAAAVQQPSGEAVCLLEYDGLDALSRARAELERFYNAPLPAPERPAGVLSTLEHELTLYFAGSVRTFSVPVVFPGSPFQQRVWEALRAIPYGRTTSYAQLAQHLGRPGGSRAVGQANGANRIAIVIPCHRVIAADGTLGGYGGELWRKQWLLDLEQGQGSTLRAPAGLAGAER